MLEQLSRYFNAVHSLRRSERAVVKSFAADELQELRGIVYHPKLLNRINVALNEHIQAGTKTA